MRNIDSIQKNKFIMEEGEHPGMEWFSMKKKLWS